MAAIFEEEVWEGVDLNWGGTKNTESSTLLIVSHTDPKAGKESKETKADQTRFDLIASWTLSKKCCLIKALSKILSILYSLHAYFHSFRWRLGRQQRVTTSSLVPYKWFLLLSIDKDSLMCYLTCPTFHIITAHATPFLWDWAWQIRVKGRG